MKKSLIIITGSLLLSGCEQVSKSIKDTFEPQSDTLAQLKNEPVPFTGESPYDAAVEKQIQEVEHLVTTVIERHSQTHIQKDTEGKNTDFLTNEEKLKSAEEALRKLPQYTGKEIKIYSTIHFYNDGRIRTMLQHPVNPEYIDNYEYRNGKWSEPEPEQISVKDHIQDRLIPLERISFTNVAKAASVYQEKIILIEGAKPITSLYISVWNNSVRWFPTSVNGSRERYSIELNQNGSLKKWERE
ncbi:hypothetical protein ACM46_16020 [Chryseobacterium angstadtii]|uniref:Lipoprotein n=1 Tax=Chryseobacterium angstadtii TaxID=558151 RepID=A0A0J7I582_9FLAO|nr:hypothetical protein [Chryseobacterium angstadtii]KMQ61517.1 hypothetical protein ACM46_16020 [Chryseobacterium angstadtii]